MPAKIVLAAGAGAHRGSPFSDLLAASSGAPGPHTTSRSPVPRSKVRWRRGGGVQVTMRRVAVPQRYL